MKNNGIDIGTLDLKHSYTCPVLSVLDQFVKLLEQTNMLYTTGNIHCDIRDTNVMIDINREAYLNNQEATISINNLRLTIIDFDQLIEKTTYKRDMFPSVYSFYNKPVEGFLLTDLLIIQGPHTNKDMENIQNRINNYVTDLFNYYESVFNIFYNIFTKEKLFDTIITKMSEYESTPYEFQSTIDTTDNFGLGFCLLKILACFYYNPNYRVKLTESEKHALDQTCDLLKNMVDFNVHMRPTPHKSYTKMQEIYNTLNRIKQDEWTTSSEAATGWEQQTRPRSTVTTTTPSLGGYQRNRMYHTAYQSHKRQTRKQRTRKQLKRRASKN